MVSGEKLGLKIPRRVKVRLEEKVVGVAVCGQKNSTGGPDVDSVCSDSQTRLVSLQKTKGERR